MNFLVCAVALALPSSMVVAQNSKVIPAANATVAGSSASMHPFSTTASRAQQVWTGSSVTSGAAFIDGFSYRCNAPRRQALQGRSYPSVTLSFGSTSITPATMTTTFASNITSAITTVFSGAYNLPPQPATQTSPSAFNINFSWSQPFVFAAASGNLLADFTVPGTSTQSQYNVDAYVAGGGSGRSVTAFGSSGTFSRPETAHLSGGSSTVTPGGSLDIICRPFINSYTGNLMFGLSRATWGAIPLPLDLSLIGATGNNLYVSMDLVLPYNTGGGGRGISSRFRTTIPTQTPVGFTFYAQAYYLDANANAAGLVTTRGLSIVIASPSGGSSVTNQMASTDSTAATGRFAFGTTLGGPIVQFTGILP
jgi:hypothetical protein